MLKKRTNVFFLRVSCHQIFICPADAGSTRVARRSLEKDVKPWRRSLSTKMAGKSDVIFMIKYFGERLKKGRP